MKGMKGDRLPASARDRSSVEMSAPRESPPMGGPRLSKSFGVNILTASATVGFRVDVLETLEIPLERPSIASVNRKMSFPNTSDTGVDHDNIRGGLRIILYGIRLRLGRFDTPCLRVVF